MKMTVALMAVVLCLGGCAKIDYIGREYPPTTHVDLFFSFDDVEQDHEVMGQILATAGDMVSAEKMQKQMMEKAREKGADAIVILGLERYISGERSSYRETTRTTDSEKKGTKETTRGVATTSAEETKEIKATLIKYK